MCDDIWSMGQNISKLDDSTVHLWYAKLDSTDEEVTHYRESLSAEECIVADRFVFDKDRNRYTVTHGILRSILALYLREDPKQLIFSHSQYGKPALSKKLMDSQIKFNLSHSHDRVLFGIAYGRNIGVDMEFIHDNFDFMSIAESNFSPGEFSALLKLPDSMKKEAFFHYWTCKEAYIKAIGKGLSFPIDKIEVSPFPDDPVTLLDSTQSNDDHGRWKLKTISYETGYAAAVVAEGKDWDMKLYKW